MTRTAADVQAEVGLLGFAAALLAIHDRDERERLELERRRREAEARRRAFRDRVAEINGGWVL